MKKQHLTWLGIALVLLVVVKVAVNRSGSLVTEDLAEAGVSRLVPEGLVAADLSLIDVRGPGAEASLRAMRDTAGAWLIASAHGAPADAEAIGKFLDAVLGLAGEVRAEDPALHEEFGLDVENAIRVELTTAAGDEPLVLLLGKSGDQATSQFMRLEGEDAVHHVSTSLRNTLGLYGEVASPKLDQWVQKQVLELEQTAIASIEMKRSDMSWSLRSAPPASQSQPASDSPPPEREWNVTGHAFDWEQQSWGASGLASRLARLRVNTVLDAESAACTFPSDAPSITVTMDDGAQHELRFGSQLSAEGDIPLRLGTDGPCYGLTKWSAQSLLPRASQLFELPKAIEDAPELDDVSSLILGREGELTEIVRRDTDDEESSWDFKGATAGPADAAIVDRLVGAVLNLSFDDLALTERLPDGAREPHASLTLKAGAREFTLTILAEREGTGGERYVTLVGGQTAPIGYSWLVSESSLSGLLISPEELKGSDPS